MPNYVSKGGVWVAAKEHAVLPHLSGTDKEVYDGPDRAAEAEFAEAYGVDENGQPNKREFGIHYSHDPDIINRARSLGFKDVKEFTKAMGYNETKKEAEKREEEKVKVVVMHKEPKKVEAVKILGGGKDLSGQGNDTLGECLPLRVVRLKYRKEAFGMYSGFPVRSP